MNGNFTFIFRATEENYLSRTLNFLSQIWLIPRLEFRGGISVLPTQ